MPKAARKKGESGFYHVVPKGIADMILFEDDGDRSLYLKWLREAKDEAGIMVHAYCLMSNHVHLVLEDRDDHMAEALKYVHERYGAYYAEQVGRRGGIFRRPFWSEPIESDEHLLCAVRYVHANPTAAGICPAAAYEWSSAKDYLGRSGGVTDSELVLDMCGGRDGFVSFSRASNMTAWAFPGSRLRSHLTDEEALRMAKEIVGKEKLQGFASLSRDERCDVVVLLTSRGFQTNQIARMVGMSESYVRKASVCG